MAIEIDRAQKVLQGGWGINVKTSQGRRWITITFETEDEANGARDKILAATENALGATIAG